MKTFALILSLALLAVPAMAGDQHPVDHSMATESGWFDMQNCVFCENLLTDPELLSHMTWETLKIDDGMMYLSTVDAEYADSYATCNAAMEKIGNDMMTGKVNPMQAKMCGSCAAFGQLLMAGVSMENVDGEAADITIFTSDDPALVAKIHAYADRNNAEMAEMMASGGGHEHSHSH